MKKLSFVLLFAFAAPLFADSAVNHLLKTYVNEDGFVHYEALCSTGQVELAAAVTEIASLTEAEFAYAMNEDQISFLINAYNIYTLKSICDHYPVESIRDIDGVWKKTTHSVLGKQMTLDHIEHKMLRVLYEEPRIHMALVCASKDCPGLRNEAFTGEKLDEQLADQTRTFLKRNRALRVDTEKNRVSISSLFDWFAKDWAHEPGNEIEGISKKYQGPIRFIIRYAPEELKDYLSKGEYKIKHIPYDWKLNSAPAK